MKKAALLLISFLLCFISQSHARLSTTNFDTVNKSYKIKNSVDKQKQLNKQSGNCNFTSMKKMDCDEQDPGKIQLQLFQEYRYENNLSLSDAVTINFLENGDNAVNFYDAPKITNPDENLARNINGTLLSIEKRAMPIDGEVLPLFISNYTTSNYVFKAIVDDLPENIQAYLQDNYLATVTEIGNNAVTVIPFSINTADSESIASDRFAITFAQSVQTFIYQDSEWSPTNPLGICTSADNIIISDGTAIFDADIEMKNLTIASGANLNVKQAMSIHNSLVNNGTIFFINNEENLGQISLTGNSSGIGTAIVQRYIPARADHKGAYRYLSSAVNSTENIHVNWQENANSMANPNPQYGMFITGNGGASNGFDETSANAPSLFLYDNVGQQYTGISNTLSNTLMAGQAYVGYVWGDRSVDILTSNDPVATTTTLQASGSIISGNIEISNFSTVAGAFNLIGNPYQAIVDMNLALAAATNIQTGYYYVWDPNLGARGAYASVNLNLHATVPSTSGANQYLMPGQSVWVVTENNANATLTFKENQKVLTADPTAVFKAENTELAAIELQLYQANRFENDQSLSDACLLNFSENGNNAVLSNDIPKLTNLDENIGIKNTSNLFSIENRALPIDGEILQLNITQYRVSNYMLNIVVENLPPGMSAYLVDNFLNSKTELVNNQTTLSAFEINASNLESSAPDRFSIVFERNNLKVNNNSIQELSIYPNPVKNGQFFIAATGLSGEKVQVSLYNTRGQKVYVSSETMNSDNRVNIPITSLEAGVYLVEMKHNEKVITGKVVVQ